jgi:hypothetical protein
MATPIGHSLMGIACGRLFEIRGESRSWRWFLFAVVAANAADFDFLPGLLVGDINRFHQGVSHSLLAAILFGSLTAVFARPLSESPIRIGMAGGAIYASHLFLDLFNNDVRAPFGLPLLWPFSVHVLSPWPLFWGVKHGVPGDDFQTVLGQLFSWHNIGSLAMETVMLSPFLFLTGRLRRGWTRPRSAEASKGVSQGASVCVEDSKRG